MNWENLTAKDFPKAVKKAKGVCILSAEVMEKHGPHLPLGTDYFIGRHIVCEAAKREPVVVFPPYYFTQIHEAKHHPGTLALSHKVMWQLLLECCDEIARNGLKKIVVHYVHGGNMYFLPYFVRLLLERERDYVVYLPDPWQRDPETQRHLEKRQRGKKIMDGHAAHSETSMMLAVAPQLVVMKHVPAKPARDLARMAHLPEAMTPAFWYSRYPDNYAGDARTASAEEGKLMLAGSVRHLVRQLKAVKKDRTAPRLLKEFYSRMRKPLQR